SFVARDQLAPAGEIPGRTSDATPGRLQHYLTLCPRSCRVDLGPERAELLHYEIGLLLKDPMPAFLDDSAFGWRRHRLGAVDGVRAEGISPRPRQYRDRQLSSSRTRRVAPISRGWTRSG